VGRVTTLAILRPIIRRIVMEGGADKIMPELWAGSYGHVHATDVTAEGISEAVAEFSKERDELEALRSRAESEGD
jgi:hypothetical protein